MTNEVAFRISLKLVAVLSAFLFVVASNPVIGKSPQAKGIEDRRSTLQDVPDESRRLVWSLTTDGLSVDKTRLNGPERIFIALPGWQWVDLPKACPPGLALGRQGEAIVTSNILPMIWRIDPVTLSVTVHAIKLNADRTKDLGFSAIVYSPRERAYFAMSDVHGSLWKIDEKLLIGEKVNLSDALPKACSLMIAVDASRRPSHTGAFCLVGEKKSWTITVARNGRSASVREDPCRDASYIVESAK
ncbi:MAG: hypothetical protein ACM3SS_01635 [Rhodospirillaceae bacterium]